MLTSVQSFDKPPAVPIHMEDLIDCEERRYLEWLFEQLPESTIEEMLSKWGSLETHTAE